MRMASSVEFASIKTALRKGVGMRPVGSGWDRSFFLSPSHQTLFCRDGDDQAANPTSSFGCFFGEGAMRRTGRGWDLSFFLAVRKRRPRPRSLTEEGGAAGDPSLFDAFVPLLLAALPAAFLITYGPPNLDR